MTRHPLSPPLDQQTVRHVSAEPEKKAATSRMQPQAAISPSEPSFDNTSFTATMAAFLGRGRAAVIVQSSPQCLTPVLAIRGDLGEQAGIARLEFHPLVVLVT